MPTKLTKVSSSKEVPIAGGATLNAGQLYVNADTNTPVVCPSAQTAATFAAALGASGVKTIDMNARSGAFADTGRPIFEV